MSLELAIVRFAGPTKADSVFGTMRERAGVTAPWTHEIALIEHHRHDRLVIHGTIGGHFVDANEMGHASESGTGAGAAAGGLVGTLVGGPAGLAPGVVIGGAVGGSAGEKEQQGEPSKLTAELRSSVPEGCSAIVLLASAEHVDEMLALTAADADIIRREVTGDEQQTFAAELAGSPVASPGPDVDGAAPPSGGEITAA